MAKKTKTNHKAMHIDCAIDLGTENVVVACKHPVFNTVTCVPMLDGGYDFPAAVYMESEAGESFNTFQEEIGHS